LASKDELHHLVQPLSVGAADSILRLRLRALSFLQSDTLFMPEARSDLLSEPNIDEAGGEAAYNDAAVDDVATATS
jgi:hypothetical protein